MSFKKREDAFENKYARDEELRFKVDIRRDKLVGICLLYTSPSPRDQRGSRMPSSA